MKILVLLLSLVLTCSAKIDSMSFFECERTKACFKTSKACTVDSCEFGITWKPIMYQNEEYIEIEMIGNVYSDNGYIMLGFSEDKSLGSDGFVSCFAENEKVKIVAGSYEISEGFDPNIKVISDDNLLVTTGHSRFGGYFNIVTKRLMCRFLRRVVPQQAPQQLKDLSPKNAYYLITARGNDASQYSFGRPSAGSLIFSEVPVDFSRGSFNPVSGTSDTDSPLAKSHGIFAVIAWVFCSSVGIILARYYKEMWPYTGIAQEMVWFQVHRILQGTCVLLTTISFFLIFAHVGGYSDLDTMPFKAHPILGIIVFILAILNPLIALCRCKPNSKNRPWFNWFHFLVGTVAYCLSVPTIMIGMRLPGAGLQLSQLDYPQWILIFFVIFQFGVEIILEIHGCLYYRRNKDKRHTFDMEIEEYQAALITNHAPQTKPLPPKPSGRMFKYLMLGLHATVSAFVALILVIIIAVN